MPTLSDRLKALGVKIGSQDLPLPKKGRSYPVEEIAAGRFIHAGDSSTYILEQDYSIDYIHGQFGLRMSTKPLTIAEWAGNRNIAEEDPESLVFLDTETSGLAGGTGTFAFLVGVGRYTPEGFHLAQFFMRDPIEEPALLLALEEFLAPCHTVVSFNGKAFDVPLLNTRYILQGWKSPFTDFSHIDLLHLSRRLWRDRLPSRTLANLEIQILHASRTDEEIPGWMIPQIYFDYLRDGDARPLLHVFYHNAMDVVSLAALLNHTSMLLETPPSLLKDQNADLAAIARLMDDLGHTERALEYYEKCLQANLSNDIYDDTLQRYALLQKRNNNYSGAIPLWEQAALRGNIYAYEELAKYYEHHALNVRMAHKWTVEALTTLDSEKFSGSEASLWKASFEHRLERLERKSTDITE